MATRTVAGETTRYNRLVQDPTTSSNIEAFSPSTTTASPSVIRRRHREPQQSSIKAMSLVGLKNIFFRQTVTPIPVPRTSDTRQTSTIPADATVVESQDSKTEKASQKKGFKVDARVISDATIGLSDGLTVPFALTAGLSALGNTKVVIYGGFAELIAGAISMGLGGYLGAKSEDASYRAQRDETQQYIATNPQAVMADVIEVFEPYNLPKHTMEDLTRALTASPKLIDFVMQFQHCAEEPASSRAVTSAITIALGYFLGGLLPLVPYFCVGRNQVYEGLYISIGVMVVALFIFGYVKTCVVVGWNGGQNIRAGCYGGVQMVIVGSAAAGAAMGLVRLFNHDEGAAGV